MRLAFLPVSKVHTNKYISCLLTMYVYCLHKFPEFVFSKLNFKINKIKSLPISFACTFPVQFVQFLAHLTQRVRWAIAITWRPSSIVHRKSPPLKVLDQWKPNLVWIITRVSSFKFVSDDAVHQPTWPLLLKIEHMVKLQVLGNNSKTVNNIKNLTSRSTYPAILK